MAPRTNREIIIKTAAGFGLVLLIIIGCSDPSGVASGLGKLKGKETSDNDKSTTTPPPPPQGSQPTGPIEPTPVNGAYLTCAWSDHSSTDNQVTVLCQVQTESSELVPGETMAKAGSKWAVTKDLLYGLPDLNVISQVLPNQAELTLSMAYDEVTSHIVSLSGPDSVLANFPLGTTLPGADASSALGQCVAQSGVPTCFEAAQTKPIMYKPGSIIKEPGVRIGGASVDVANASCGSIANGGSTTIVRYLTPTPAVGQACQSETQILICDNGKLVKKAGGHFAATSCTQSRKRFFEDEAVQCRSETQKSNCTNGSCSNYTGTAKFTDCQTCRAIAFGRCVPM